MRGLLLRRLHVRTGGGLHARPDRNPGLQRQQQLFDRIHGALHGEAVRRGRPRRLRARARLREDGEGIAGDQIHGPQATPARALQDDARAPWPRRRAGGTDDVRKRRTRAHGTVRDHEGAVREDRGEESRALHAKPLRPIPGPLHARGDPGVAHGARPANEAPVLPHLRRSGRGDHLQRRVRSPAPPRGPRHRDRRNGHDDRLHEHLRGEVLHQARGART